MGKLTDEDWDIAGRILSITNGILSGSIHVDAEAANDIDIVVEYPDWISNHDQVLAEYPNLCHSATESNTEYDVSVYELHFHHRIGNVNILVYNPYFIPAIRAAIRDMKALPERYKTREERIKLHQGYKQVIRDMLDPDKE